MSAYITSPLTSFPSIQSIAIIGAGAAGLIAAKTMHDADFHVELFEKQSQLGGIWKFDEQTPMYDSLRTNLPKEIMGFNQHFPLQSENSNRSFLTHCDILSYLESFGTMNNLHRFIHFNTNVTRLIKLSTGKWEVTSITTQIEDSTQETKTTLFDAVMICNGHFDIPYYSTIPGLIEYCRDHGEIKHARDYQSFKPECHHKRILIIGTKSSGTDIARELSSPELHNTIYISDRNISYDAIDRAKYQKAENICLLPAIDSITSSGSVVLSNQDILPSIDMILFCTGYQYSYPFFEGTILSACPNGRRVHPLYQQLFLLEDPTLTFIGLPFSIVPFPMFYLQCEWIASVYTGRTQLPPIEEQNAWLEKFENELHEYGWYEEKYHYMGGKRQWEYDYMIIETAELCQQDPDILRYIQMIEEIYEDVVQHRPEYTGASDTYRDRVYHIDREKWTWTVNKQS